MMLDANIGIALDLPNVTVFGVEASERGYMISVESTLKGTQCGRLGQKIQAFHGYNDWVAVLRPPIRDRRRTSATDPSAIAVRTVRANQQRPKP